MSEREPVGTLAEEAARLLAAVHVWAGDSGPDSAPDPGAPGDDASAANGGPDHHEDQSHDHEHEHESVECHWCPLCRLVRAARSTTPEVRDHLSQAAISLALAVKGLLDDPRTATRRETPLEKIDLTESDS
jgi:hypothetical protein